MAVIFIRMECLTNMHAGNGDVNYNIIDNEVERDPTTGYPTVNASGMKGALREYFQRKLPEKADEMFGMSADKTTAPGKLRILAAEMLAIPMRATAGNSPYWLVSTQKALDRYAKLREFLGCGVSALSSVDCTDVVEAEGIRLTQKYSLWGKNIYLMEQSDFADVSLPVLARNKLDNGKSTNLWYEEVVPHESLFYFPVLAEDDRLLSAFVQTISGKVVQFGGNASIGYGLCRLTVDGGEEE